MIDLGPGPAERGGEVVIEGTPATVAGCKKSLTGKVLQPILDAGPYAERKVFDPKEAARKALGKEEVRSKKTGARRQKAEAGEPGAMAGARGSGPGYADSADSDDGRALPEEDESPPGSQHARQQRGRGTPRGAARASGAMAALSAAMRSPEDDEPIAESTDWSALPWKKDGQSWHLEQRHRTADQPRRWDAEALRWLIKRVEQVDAEKFEHADWANVAHVEVRGVEAKESADWFLHVLTGGSDLFDAYFRVPGRHVPGGQPHQATGDPDARRTT